MTSAPGEETAGPVVRPEAPEDEDAIRRLTSAAFLGAPHSSGTEAAIVDALRGARALALSLVAEATVGIVGHVAFSAVTIDGAERGWFGLGPVSVEPGWQRRGIGSALIHDGLARLRVFGAAGCVVLGDPAFYRRFGFTADPRLRLANVPPEYFQCLAFAGAAPEGEVAFHPGFGATG